MWQPGISDEQIIENEEGQAWYVENGWHYTEPLYSHRVHASLTKNKSSSDYKEQNKHTVNKKLKPKVGKLLGKASNFYLHLNL